jgi:diguanylate cyclase (GGDEF)-like protein
MSSEINDGQLPAAVEAADKLRDLIEIDPKTGLYKQEALLACLSRSIEDLSPEDSLVFYVADLDGFKSVNDALGHSGGDRLLAVVAQAFRSAFARSSDIITHGSRENDKNGAIARLGGDEFAVYELSKTDDFGDDKRAKDLEDKPAIQAKRVNEQLLELIAGTEFAGFDIKLSIGSTTFTPGQTAEELFAVADQEMFKVKYAGKIEQISEEDKRQLLWIIPFLEAKQHRVEPWLRVAAGLPR